MTKTVGVSAEDLLKKRVMIDGDASLVGVVTGVRVHVGHCLVEVAWAHGGDVRSAWVEDWRVTLAGEA